MKKLALITVLFAFIFTANANEKVEEKKDNIVEQVKHPKRKIISGKTVTRADYVKTSNPKRLHWNRIHERNNLVKSNVINRCPKRRNLVRLLSLEKKATGSTKSHFVQRKRKNG